METFELDAVVIGGGVVGVAVARELALRGREVTLLEAENRLGNHSSSRNSEVIHAGIYYAQGSLKAKLCTAGKARMYEYCAAANVPHRRIGKLIVATTEAEIGALDGILARAVGCGVTDLQWLEASEISRLEPAVRAVRGLFSPSTGIVDSHELMAAMRRDARAHGAHIGFDSPVVGGAIRANGIELRVGGAEPSRVRCATVVNAAGLRAQDVARSLEGLSASTIPGQYYAKGHYFTLAGRSPFAHLVYPVPVSGGLGVHVTLDLAGQTRFGPDVSWLDGVDYAFDESRAEAFCAAIRRYFPSLANGALVPGYTGIRPKLSPAGSPADDFLVQGPSEHGVPGLVNLYGIESPGLTASLALAELVAARLEQR
jgi:L-2-hydroxyglutarate oxidase LhgO